MSTTILATVRGDGGRHICYAFGFYAPLVCSSGEKMPAGCCLADSAQTCCTGPKAGSGTNPGRFLLKSRSDCKLQRRTECFHLPGKLADTTLSALAPQIRIQAVRHKSDDSGESKQSEEGDNAECQFHIQRLLRLLSQPFAVLLQIISSSYTLSFARSSW